MVKDFKKSKPVSKNRPRKQPLAGYAFAACILSLVFFLAGVSTGWFFFRYQPQKVAAKQPQNQAAGGKPESQRIQGPNLPPPTGEETPLTFYKTLPAGANAVIGSGLNLKKELHTVPAKPNQPTIQAPPQAQQSAAVSPVIHPKEPAKQQAESPSPSPTSKPAAKVSDKESATAKSTQQGLTAYTVQVASHRDKTEADALKSKLQARGLAAYVQESRLQDNSVRYRVRIGKSLTQEQAKDLAGAAGKGAIAVPE
jgi:cell division protein FtsN